MDIYQALKKDHRIVKSLFSKLLKTSLADQSREDIFIKLKNALTSNHRAEEEVFYAALETEDTLENDIENAREQHEEVLFSLEEIEAIDPQNQDWEEKMMELQDYLQEHIKAEEGVVFTEARQIFSDRQARELAQEFVNAKKEAECELTTNTF